MSQQLPHFVTVTDGKITDFTCPWKYGECHFYPSCSCESWCAGHFRENGVGHEPIWHERCWMDLWFTEVPEYGTAYTGDDYDDMIDGCIPQDKSHRGQIETSFHYEYIEWSFTS